MPFKGFFTNSSGILFSRIAGFVRDLSMSSILGTGVYSDLFLIAFKIPNIFRRIFAEGAFNQSFLPSFSSASYKGAFTLKIGLSFLFFITILSLFITIFSPYVAQLLAIGLDETEDQILAHLVSINFWYLPLIFVVSLFGAILQYKHNFTAAAYSTLFLNLAMIVALLWYQDQDEFEIVIALSYAVLAGGCLQIAIHLYPLKRLGFFRLFCAGFKHIKLKKDALKKDVKHFYSQFFPAMIGGSTVQLASLIDVQLASFLTVGSISHLHYASRIFQLPLALFAIATSIALYPMVLKAIKNQDIQKAKEQLKSSCWFLLIILSICTLAGMILSHEIIWILFERGNFSAKDSLETGHILFAYLIGLLPFGLAKIFSLWLYSHHQQMLAAKISIKSLLVGTGFSLILMWEYGAFGLALAGSISGFALLYWSIRAFGFYNFFVIINDKKKWFLLFIALAVAFPILLMIKQGLEYLYQTYY